LKIQGSITIIQSVVRLIILKQGHAYDLWDAGAARKRGVRFELPEEGRGAKDN
jgi:hypothetical protein